MLRRLQHHGLAAIGCLPFKPVIRVQSAGCGFFGDLFMSLNGLRLVERYRLAAQVFWGVRSLYFERARGPNAWSYFFERNSFSHLESARCIPANLPYWPDASEFLPYEGLSVRASVHRALRSWCQPRGEILTAVQAFVDQNFIPNATLGVHVRLTDAAAGQENRKTVEMQHFIQSANDWLAARPDGRIFLAADDERVVQAFRARFGERVVYQRCLRSTDGTSLHGHYDCGVKGSPYRKGVEVLIDALLLARCDHLVRTHSRVTCFTLCINLHLTYTDLDLKHLGINRTPWLHV